jgi:hypothetical protein
MEAANLSQRKEPWTMTTKRIQFEIIASVRGLRQTFTVWSDTQDHAVNSVQRQLTPFGGVVVSIAKLKGAAP